MGNYQTFKTIPHFNKKQNISFGGEEEEEMIQKFNAFNILWYAPENSEKLDEWIAFTNVEVIKAIEEEDFLKKALSSIIFFPIIITTGTFAEKTIPKIYGKFPFPNVLIYCMNIDYHKKWSEKYEIIVGVFAHPSQIFKYLLEYQKNGYEIPIFNYNIYNLKEFDFNYYDCMNKEEVLANTDNFSLKFNIYEKFLVHKLHDLKFAILKLGNYYIKFISKLKKALSLFYKITFYFINDVSYTIMNIPLLREEANEILKFTIGLILLSLYFSKFPYLYGFLKYEEIEELLIQEYKIEDLKKEYKSINDTNVLNIQVNKLIIKQISILEDTKNLKIIHTFLVNFIKYQVKIKYGFGLDNNKDYSKFPIMIKYLMDLDFCLKLFLVFFTEIIDFNSDIFFRTAMQEDKRVGIFLGYCNIYLNKELALEHISEENFNTMNETLKIRDFIVIGDENFLKKIKDIEKNFKHKKIAYLSMDKMREYLNSKKNEKYRNFFYFFIISSEEANIYFKELYSIRYDFGLLISLIIYDDNEIYINKMPFVSSEQLSIFIANSEIEIINYINGQENLNCGHNFRDITLIFNDFLKSIELYKKLKFPKVQMENEEKDEQFLSEDGWELVEFVPKEIMDEKIFGFIGDRYPTEKIRLNMLEIYKENKIDSSFYDTYCKYFYYNLIPELCINPLKIGLTHICYAYTLHEEKNSFFYIMNRDLRQGDPLKIVKYLNLISLFNLGIKDNIMKSYEGVLYRATKINKEFIDKNIIEGKVLTNLSFWSATKERKIAENFLSDSFRNILFIITSKKLNIDIEDISKFSEKEVLFLPYSKFLIISKEKKLFNNKEVYEVKIEGLDEQHERENIKTISILAEFLNFVLDKNK